VFAYCHSMEISILAFTEILNNFFHFFSACPPAFKKHEHGALIERCQPNLIIKHDPVIPPVTACHQATTRKLTVLQYERKSNRIEQHLAL
jgi:hypothetical protein